MSEPVVAPFRARAQRFVSPERPPLVVRLAFWLILASLAISIFLLVVHIIGFDWATYVSQSHLKEDHEGRPRLTDRYLLFGLVMSWSVPVAVVALWAVVAAWLRRGFEWARIVSSASAAFALIALLFGRSDFLSILLAPLDLAPAVLVWLPTSNRYFAAVSLARRRHKARQLT